MAEAFARTYGSDVIAPASAGLFPAFCVAPDTRRAMMEKGISLDSQFPKSLRQMLRAPFDIVVNMSGDPIEAPADARMLEWRVDDPVSMGYRRHCGVRDRIERLVMDLILELRRAAATR
jgi:protein-tyrosine-phosphatase